MNFGTINIKGAGGVGKSKAVRGLLSKYGLNFVAIQETQFSELPERIIKRFWDNTVMDYIKVNADGRSGGLLSMWSPGVFTKESEVLSQNFILVKGKVTGEQEDMIVVNVYASTVQRNRRQMWNELLLLKQSIHGRWILLGDFNEVRFPKDRFNSQFDVGGGALCFNNFIMSAGLQEYNMGEGEFIMRWPDATLLVLNRDVSDHCPLILTTSVNNFGPIPFRVFHTWMEDQGFDEAVKRGLNKGCDSIFKDERLGRKFKAIKDELKSWRISEKAKEEEKLATANENIQKIETEAETRSLSEQEIEMWQG
ncbi:uncharacterized protein LOC110919629 [Helianthus annuus]|uniref:uncharacterized protein LOC110919629 n=1 Tax=Helianthus annuus TaxID=4232 RepID=UPI000B901138|nr:uncharacterized protein LOC110919629 [Helianthus annuus]